MAARMAMMAMTTNSSIRVKARRASTARVEAPGCPCALATDSRFMAFIYTNRRKVLRQGDTKLVEEVGCARIYGLGKVKVTAAIELVGENRIPAREWRKQDIAGGNDVIVVVRNAIGSAEAQGRAGERHGGETRNWRDRSRDFDRAINC